MTIKGKDFESIQDFKATTRVRLKTQKRTSRAASESNKNNGINIFETRGSILSRISDNLSSTAMDF